MLGLIGIRKNVDIKIREKLSITTSKQIKVLEELKQTYNEVVIISTCNRTEIYYETNFEEDIVNIFKILGWDLELREYIFCLKGNSVAKHLLEVVCGFHSKILGEDQILGQIKDAYEISMKYKALDSKLLRLFEDAISCGKKFRSESRLYRIPVSSSSIAVNKAISFGAKSIMVLGYGTIGSLVVKYALGTNINRIFIVVRNKNKVKDLYDERIRILNFEEYKEIINEVDAIISCTSAPHIVIESKYISCYGKNITMIDLALPRDIDENVKKNNRVTLLDIDDISKLDIDNKKLRSDRMEEYRFLIDDYLSEYIKWLELREVTYYIKKMKEVGEKVSESRIKSFEHKCKNQDDFQLASTLIKSTSDYYINKAIKILKEEKLKGREEVCLKILSQIFMEK